MIKNIANRIINRSERKIIERIKASNLVLDKWYKEYYTDLTGSSVDPTEHYYYFGWKEGRRPNPYFDTNWFIKEYDISEKECPLVYFLNNRESNPCLAFDINKYKNIRPNIKNPLAHYINHGYKEESILETNKLDFIQKKFEIQSSGLFDSKWYQSIRPDLNDSSVNLLDHYIHFGWKEGSRPNPYFDPLQYSHFAGIEDRNIEPLTHYHKVGWRKRISPSEDFDTAQYLEYYPDIKEANIDPLHHYIKHGKQEGRIRLPVSANEDISAIINSRLFLSDWYLTVNEDLRDSGIDALKHFLYFGWKENRNPNPYFNTEWYKKNYSKELINSNEENPLLHYIREGHASGLNPSMKFDCLKYKEKYISDDNEPLAHYLVTGKKQGNSIFGINERIKSEGGWLKTVKETQLITDNALRAMLDFDEKPLNTLDRTYNKGNLKIHWVMPDFAPGAGGHMTIFRTIRYLEIFGHTNTIWIYNPSIHDTEDNAYCDIVKHFQLIKAQVNFIDDSFKNIAGDAIFATDWGSVSYVKSTENFKRRFYFVQDHEPEFYPQGSYSLAAKMSYDNDLDCICASPWLKQLMENKYNRWADYFWLSVDKNVYKPPKFRPINKRCKIAFYARNFTPRRAVELGFLALEALARTGIDFEIHCFGAPLPFNETPFDCFDHGILSPVELAELYQQCDLGIVFSATNYSLIPQEMMACGLALAELDVDSTQAIFPTDVVTLLSPNPRQMSEQLKLLVEDKNRREQQAKNALKWVSQFSWEDSARRVEASILSRFRELDFESFDESAYGNEKTIKASVIIPTWNAGGLFKTVIEKLSQQITPWKYEIFVIDSGSTDGTVEFLEACNNVKVYKIDNSEFQHGRTRNLAISMTKGEYIAVITQDALPVSNYWLYDLVSSLEHYPEAAGAFGRHFAWDNADPFTKRDIQNHFDNLTNHPLCVSKNTDIKKWSENDLHWKQMLHYYSDNNSCMRRSVWEQLPYPEVKFGEDQAWAWEIIKAGYGKVYAEKASVFHSHDFDEGDVEKRAYEEAEFFRDIFGYTMVEKPKIEETIESLVNSDTNWAEENNVDLPIIERRVKAIRSRIFGYSKAVS